MTAVFKGRGFSEQLQKGILQNLLGVAHIVKIRVGEAQDVVSMAVKDFLGPLVESLAAFARAEGQDAFYGEAQKRFPELSGSSCEAAPSASGRVHCIVPPEMEMREVI